jgi:hypothetical protein
MERCRRIINPEDFRVAPPSPELEDDYKKRRTENTIFKHDHLRIWDTTYN